MNKRALVISGVKWDATYQRHHLNTKILAKNGYKVDFLEGCKTSKMSLKKIIGLLGEKLRNFSVQKKDNSLVKNARSDINVFSLFFLPPGGFFSSQINGLLFNIFHFRKLATNYDLILIYTPSDHVKFLNVDDSYLIYDCVRAFSVWGGYHKSLYENEKLLFSKAHKVTCDSFYLKDIHLPELVEEGKISHLIPPLEVELTNYSYSLSNDIKVIGYFGSVSDHIDITIFDKLLESGYEIHFWGVDDEGLLPEKVVNHGYVSDQKELFAQLSLYCCALIIPYKYVLDGVYPAKLAISLATRLPVFSSKFYDSKKLSNMLYVYDNMEGLLKTLNGYNIEEHNNKIEEINLFVEGIDIDSYTSRFNSTYE